MGDPRRPAWLCSPTPRPWGFRGNFRAQQQHQHQTCFVVSWMSGWGMNRRIHKTTWDKKKESRNCSFPVLIGLSIPAYRYFFPLPLFQCPDGAANVAPNATVVWCKQTPTENQSVSEGFRLYFAWVENMYQDMNLGRFIQNIKYMLIWWNRQWDSELRHFNLWFNLIFLFSGNH